MRLSGRRSRSDRVREIVSDSLDAVSGGLTKEKVLKGSLVAGALAGLTAGSAAISSLRRRQEGTARSQKDHHGD